MGSKYVQRIACLRLESESFQQSDKTIIRTTTIRPHPKGNPGEPIRVLLAPSVAATFSIFLRPPPQRQFPNHLTPDTLYRHHVMFAERGTSHKQQREMACLLADSINNRYKKKHAHHHDTNNTAEKGCLRVFENRQVAIHVFVSTSSPSPPHEGEAWSMGFQTTAACSKREPTRRRPFPSLCHAQKM